MSAGGALGGGKTKQTTYSPAADTLAQIAQQFVGETAGVRGGLINAMQEVLKTGGSTIPIISRSVERTRQEASKAQQQTEEELAQQGLAGTPFGEMIKAQTAQEGNIAAGQTEQSLAQNIFNMISNFVLGQSQTALSGLQGAIPGLLSQKGTYFDWGTGASAGFGGGK
jgi:NAD dependent epimerase/dehydratase family enzyme